MSSRPWGAPGPSSRCPGGMHAGPSLPSHTQQSMQEEGTAPHMWKVPNVSISITVRKPLGDSCSAGDRKLPAAGRGGEGAGRGQGGRAVRRGAPAAQGGGRPQAARAGAHWSQQHPLAQLQHHQRARCRPHRCGPQEQHPPAQLTKMSSRPNLATASATMRWQSSKRRTSPWVRCGNGGGNGVGNSGCGG